MPTLTGHVMRLSDSVVFLQENTCGKNNTCGINKGDMTKLLLLGTSYLFLPHEDVVTEMLGCIMK